MNLRRTPGHSVTHKRALYGLVYPRKGFSCQTSRGHVRVTQRISFHGPGADDYVERMGSAFEQGVPQGMARLAAAIRQFAATHDAG